MRVSQREEKNGIKSVDISPDPVFFINNVLFLIYLLLLLLPMALFSIVVSNARM